MLHDCIPELSNNNNSMLKYANISKVFLHCCVYCYFSYRYVYTIGTGFRKLEWSESIKLAKVEQELYIYAHRYTYRGVFRVQSTVSTSWLHLANGFLGLKIRKTYSVYLRSKLETVGRQRSNLLLLSFNKYESNYMFIATAEENQWLHVLLEWEDTWQHLLSLSLSLSVSVSFSLCLSLGTKSMIVFFRVCHLKFLAVSASWSMRNTLFWALGTDLSIERHFRYDAAPTAKCLVLPLI